MRPIQLIAWKLHRAGSWHRNQVHQTLFGGGIFRLPPGDQHHRFLCPRRDCHRFFRRSTGHSTSSDLVQSSTQTPRRPRPTSCTLCSAWHHFTFSGCTIQGTRRQHTIGVRCVDSRADPRMQREKSGLHIGVSRRSRWSSVSRTGIHLAATRVFSFWSAVMVRGEVLVSFASSSTQKQSAL